MTTDLNKWHQHIRQKEAQSEPACVQDLLQVSKHVACDSASVQADSEALIAACRARKHEAGSLDAFLQEFGLSNREGVALMCLAEALLRVPDAETADRLIAEKLGKGEWSAHKGQSESLFVNASVWGLMLTGKVIDLHDDSEPDGGNWFSRMRTRLGEPVVRRAVYTAMRIMGGQFVLGKDMRQALKKSQSDTTQGLRFSFDMLGEGARTAADAERYAKSYSDAIATIITHRASEQVELSDGISIKLSALHPRFDQLQLDRVEQELYPSVLALALQAKIGGIGLSIDAEEVERLELNLRIFEKLAREPQLSGWQGLGFVLQAYQTRAIAVCDWLIALAKETDRRLMVRLVKGAYWDREVKRAQELGLPDYPVFTRKCHTDVSYHACASRLFDAGEALYPQFASHNAQTLAYLMHLAPPGAAFELQRLHGMGELLYDVVKTRYPDVPVRVYAPVGNHTDLLPYLVRRLLENGANSSFVNRFLDAKTPVSELAQDPLDVTQSNPELRHTGIPLPHRLFCDQVVPWQNSGGLDLYRAADYECIQTALAKLLPPADRSGSGSAETPVNVDHGALVSVKSPADHARLIGSVREASSSDSDRALEEACRAQQAWCAKGVEFRAACLDRIADELEAAMPDWVGLISVEAGRTLADGISEVREAIDFCRYYAQQARHTMTVPLTLPGPTGESNTLSWHGRGVWVCISPWNFPLAIFVGQIVAALVTGNSVIAKPAEQTPLVALKAVQLMHRCGVPESVLHCLLGAGADVGAKLVADPRISGVVFTGGTDTAQTINRSLATRPGPITPLIAETGGLNVMLVDATALPEQVVDDVIMSAFHSAGQRCSALRVLYLQQDIADHVLAMLAGAMSELVVGLPWETRTDVGPLIDASAQQKVLEHIQAMHRDARLIAATPLPEGLERGHFVAPHAFEIESLAQLEQEIFGPVLHVIRYARADLPKVYQQINDSGYGLTLGVHSRIDGFARSVFRNTRVGNTYVNRNMIGAVVGVNPFGGQGLSGTGPKAGGPHYLQRFATERTYTDNLVARGGNTDLFTMSDS